MTQTYEVLLVDDDEGWVTSTAQLLEQQRDAFTVRAVTDLASAADAFAADEPDCVVCDYGLEAGTGLDLLETVREHDPDQPFILITGQGSESVASDAIGRAVTDYIPKRSLGGRDDLLARRIESAVESYRTEQALARERRSKEAMLEILTAASSRAGLAERFCDHLVSERGYACAWIGTVRQSMEVLPRAVAGDSGYVDAVIGPDARPAAGGEPALDTLATREPRVVAPIDADGDGWRGVAAEYGFGSAAAVPITHDGSVLGVLAVYGEGERVDDVERDLLTEYGAAIGYAMRSAAWRESLLSATPVTVDVELRDDDAPLVAFDRQLPSGATTRVLTTGLQSDTALYVVEVGGAAPADVRTAADAAAGVEDATVTRDDGPLRCDLTVGLPVPETVVADRGARVVEATVERGRAALTVVAGEEADVQPLVERLQSTYPDTSVTSIRSAEPGGGTDEPLAALTDKQRRAIEMAFHNGYFERPRDHDTREVAAKLGVTRQTLTQHLRAGQRNLFGTLLDEE